MDMQVDPPALDLFAQLGVEAPKWLGAQWFGIAVWQYVFAFLLIVLTLFARRLADLFLNRLVVPWIDRAGGVYTSRIVGAVSKPLTAVLGLVGLYLATRILIFSVAADPSSVVSLEFIDQSFQVAIAGIAVWTVMRLVDVLAVFLRERAQENDLPVDVPVIPLLRRSLKIFVGVVGGLLVIQHMGYPIASLLGGLGIGGLAVALAAQDTLSNVFGSVIVFTDKPFKVGDWIQIGDVDGFVEAIGFRSTRIRTWPKTLVTIPNKTIANAQIENWSAMPKRRVSFTLRVGYAGTADQIEALVEGIRKIVREHPGIDQEFSLITFTGFGDSGFEFLIYYFTVSIRWAEHMQVRQEVNLAIMRLMDELGLSLGMPSRQLFAENDLPVRPG